ncbi:MAG: class I SAM-dependent methyltransferase [Candidatus Hydrogenedentes bacterium]|nr:class I SAM-dependent methyltransferase [Candidatus Hydrogenedentota bacterium]
MDPRQLFTEQCGPYELFIRSAGYTQGLRTFFVRSGMLRPGSRILDAGCGTGALSLAMREAALRLQFTPPAIQGFDLTPAMLERFRNTLVAHGIDNAELVQSNVLHLDALPASWNNYDLIATASMMEYLSRNEFNAALRGLRARLSDNGALLLFITRRNWITRPLIGRWWHANLYTAKEIQAAFQEAGFPRPAFHRFPFPYGYLNVWGYIVEAPAGFHTPP